MAISSNGNVAEVTRLKKLARLKKFDELESAWLSAIGNNHFTLENYMAVLAVVAEQNEPKQTENLVWLLLSMTGEHKGVQNALEVARTATNLVPKSETIRTETAELYRKAYGELPDIDFLLEMTILRQGSALNTGVQQIDKFIALEEAGYAIDKNLPVPGKIVGLDKDENAITIIFDGEETKYTAPLLNRLEPMTGEDFRALKAFEPAKLEELAQDDPGELAHLILKAYGPTLKFREIKPHIAPFLKGETWTKWWQEAKPKIKRSPIVELTDAAQPTFTLRARPLSYSYRVRDQFASAETFEEKLVAVLEYLQERHADSAPDETLVTYFAEQLRKHGSRAGDTVSQLAGLAGLGRLHKHFPEIVPHTDFDFDAVFSADADLTMFFGTTFNDDVAKIVLDFIRDEKPDQWYDLFAGMMPGASANVCEWIAGELLPQGYRDSLAKSVEAILHWPDRYPRAIVWLCKAVCGEKCPEPLAEIDKSTLQTGLFTAASALKRKPPFEDAEQQKRALNQIRNVLTANNYDMLRIVLKASGKDYANYIKDTYAFNPGFSDAVKTDIGMVLRQVRPDLFAKSLPPWEEDVVYTTEAALERKNEELAKLVNVDIAHNAKTIGEAAERGDLSENAEFTAALEERDRLTERASRLQAELKKAKTIYPGFAANSKIVTIGTKVRVIDLADNEEKTFTFLGPWDADPNQGTYSYLAPLAQSFMGKKAGEIVVHNPDAGKMEWKILDIAPAI
jgi:transcription elongation factor GreA